MPHRRAQLPLILAAALLIFHAPAPLLAQPDSAATAPATSPAADAAPTPSLHVLPPPQPAPPIELGSLDRDLPYKIKVGLEHAALWYIHLTDYLYAALSDPTNPDSHYLLQSKVPAPGGAWHRPLAPIAITINGRRLDLSAAAWTLLSVDRDDHDVPVAAAYSLTIADDLGRPVLEIRRSLHLAPNSYELLCRQSLVNLQPAPLVVSLEQFGPTDTPPEHTGAGYGIDPRGLWLGYFNLKYDPDASLIFVDDNARVPHAKLAANEPLPWPPSRLDPAQARLAWLANVNRYFAAVIHRPVVVPAAAPINAKLVSPLQDLFPAFSTQVLNPAAPPAERHCIITLGSPALDLAPSASVSLDFALFAGPRSPDVFQAPVYQALFFNNLIHYSLGGCCAILTFQWLARLLLAFMTLIHAVTFDWAVAIIFLVVAVRIILHPLTRKSQVHMTRFGKQMATLKPELDALKRKYEKDQRRFQTEQARLMREKGVSPAVVLGCLPMFLQMPIWIALYAMLFYAIELRHQPAFWSVFQTVSANQWPFLADLSSPDHFLVFADHPIHVNFPLISVIDFSALNILPLLWGVLMFIQQKFMAPPAPNEQAAQQQKIMMYSMLLFPFLLYSSPSGLTLYILASTAAGIIDSHLVKQHIKREEAAGTFLAKKERKSTGFFARLGRGLENIQQQREDRQRRLQGDDRSRYRDR